MYLSVEQFINDPVKPYWGKLTVYDARKRCNVIGEIKRRLPLKDHAQAYRAAVGILKEATHSKWQETWRVVAWPESCSEYGLADFIDICESNRLARILSPHYQGT